VYRIAREALRNAAQHAEARHIEVGLHYAESAFILRIRDDGIGIDTNVVRAGQRAGHWGLQGMRERAESFGARLEVWSERGAGTEIELSVPAELAYDGAMRGRSWLGFLARRRRF
jgi:signal transduction histidine kinase